MQRPTRNIEVPSKLQGTLLRWKLLDQWSGLNREIPSKLPCAELAVIGHSRKMEMLSDTEHHSRARDILSTRILLAPWSLSPLASIFRASSRVAQLVEQPAVNRRLGGSGPSSGASQLSAPQFAFRRPVFALRRW